MRTLEWTMTVDGVSYGDKVVITNGDASVGTPLNDQAWRLAFLQIGETVSRRFLGCPPIDDQTDFPKAGGRVRTSIMSVDEYKYLMTVRP